MNYETEVQDDPQVVHNGHVVEMAGYLAIEAEGLLTATPQTITFGLAGETSPTPGGALQQQGPALPDLALFLAELFCSDDDAWIHTVIGLTALLK